MTARQREELASQRLRLMVDNKQQEMELFFCMTRLLVDSLPQEFTFCCCLDIIETALYVLWCHLEFFFVHCTPRPMDAQLGLDWSSSSMRRLQGMFFKIASYLFDSNDTVFRS